MSGRNVSDQYFGGAIYYITVAEYDAGRDLRCRYSECFRTKTTEKGSKICKRYGMRVQNSVFEVLLDAAQLVVLKHELEKIIDTEQDSVRFYRLGNSYERRIETMGKRPRVEAGGALIF